MEKTKLNPPSTWDGETLFERIPSDKSGINVAYDFNESHPLRRLYPYGWATGNVAIGDLNGDGRADLFFPGTTSGHRLFIQGDDFTFNDVTALAQVSGSAAWSSSAILGDIDNDKDLDIFVINYESANELFINISSGGVVRFVEAAADYELNIITGAQHASFVDFDSDGNLDLYLQTYHIEPEGGRPDEIETRVNGKSVAVDPQWQRSYLGYLDKDGEPQWVEAPLPDRLYRNNGTGKFVHDTSLNLGLGGSYTTSHIWWDLDHNLAPDLYLSNDSHGPDLLFLNRSGKPFLDISLLSLPNTPWFSRGAAAADFNGDLLIDLFASESAPITHLDRLAYGEPFRPDVFRMSQSGGPTQVTRNTLFANTGSSRFAEIGRMAGLANTGATWSVKSADYDGDGWTDVFLTTGDARDWTSVASNNLSGESLQGKTRWDILENSPSRREADKAFRNLGNWQFEESAKAWGLDHVGMSYSASQGDLDGDGDLDLIVCPLGEEVLVYRNHSQAPRIVIDARGEQTNTHGIGCELLAEIGDRKFVRQMFPNSGFKGSDEAAFFLPTLRDQSVDKITIRWPVSGAMETLTDLEPGFRYSLREAYSVTAAVEREGRESPMFVGSRVLDNLSRPEQPFNDYQSEAFLPPGWSRTGPGIAAAHLNQDDFAEIIFGGSTGNGPRMAVRTPDLSKGVNTLAAERQYEDTGMVFFDADNDGTSDLFVASGGIEAGNNSALLQDRLYLNKKDEGFVIDEAAIPSLQENSSTVTAADFDRDGDVDLFVGAGFEPGKYPSAGTSRLLVNDGNGKFTDQTESKANGLQDVGFVTGAIWTDVDNDGWLDLMITCHWGGIKQWKNREGTLFDRTSAAELDSLTGLWNGITGRDINNDGDIDYLVTNEGLNSGKSSPANLYRGDFLGIGRNIILETVSENGSELPLLGWLDLAEAAPAMLDTIKSPQAFTSNFLPEHFNQAAFDKAEKWSVSHLETGLLLNDGEGNFTFTPLPGLVQDSQGYGSILTDVNFDGICDAYVVQNRGSATVRRPDPMETGVSQFFLGTGNSETPFQPIVTGESGLLAIGPARGVIATDLNKDNKPDFIVSLNDNDPAVFINAIESEEFEPLKVPLNTVGKNPAGARVTVEIADFPTQTAEYYAGDGYLSQSPPELFFGSPAEAKGKATVNIRWADGTTTRRRIYFDSQ